MKTKTITREASPKMDEVPLIPKPKVLPNLDATPLIREIFQNEFEYQVPTKKVSQNILASFEYRKEQEEEQRGFRNAKYLDELPDRTENIIQFTKNVIEAHKNHQIKLEEIGDAEKHLLETHVDYLEREKIILENPSIRESLRLKRQPLFKALDPNYVRKYKLLQGDAGLPPEPELKSDFRVQNFKAWRKKLDDIYQENYIAKLKAPASLSISLSRTISKPCGKHHKTISSSKKKIRKPPRAKPKTKKIQIKENFKANPKVVLFTDYKLGDVYEAEISVKNTQDKALRFQIKSTNPDGPFRVTLSDKSCAMVTPGLKFYLKVWFTPKSLDNAAEDLVIVTEDGNRFLIPLIAYLEPPILKTHKEIDEFTKVTSEKILSSYIECGVCFTGDTKVTKLNFRCYRGTGEFIIMSAENWSRSCIDTMTVDNILEIPPFRVYPAYFKMEKNQVIDLFVEFIPKTSGTHIENIVIVCDNGQIRSLDLIGDAAGWHSYYFTFQDFLLKELPVEADDDLKVKHYLDFEETAPNGHAEKVFCVSNNSDMAYEFQWKIREANILMSQEKYLKLSKDQVKIEPENGTFEPNSIWKFIVTIAFNNAEVGNYRMVLSLYVLNLPYQCIEEDDTVIQPTGFVRNLYCQSLYGEEESCALSPELTSLQGTYESLQESIKSYVEYQNKSQAVPRFDFCKTTCIPNPGLCAKPLKKSKTFVNIGDNIEEVDGHACACRPKPEAESNSDSCTSNQREEKVPEITPPKNEVIWDFVDILVNEVELWVEVSPTRVTVEPAVLQLDRIPVSDRPIFKEVRVINHNQFSVTCTWLIPPKTGTLKKNSSSSAKGPASFALLFDKYSRHQRQLCGEQSEQTEETKPSEPENENFDYSEPCRFCVKPQKNFRIPSLSEFTCRIEISVGHPGKIHEILCLSVNETELQLNLLILGTAFVKSIETSPDVLDFGVLKQGHRYSKDFVIVNKSSNTLFWRINQFEFDFAKKKFFGHADLQDTGYLKNTAGVIAKTENHATETCCINAKAPGIKYSLLEVEEIIESLENPEKQYILVLGDVRLPDLWLSSPRFENAILAPSGKMYVGKKVSTKVTLKNVGVVETFFTWGHPFGCHCRKIKVEISPKSSRIEEAAKLTVSIDLTALDEGIISHCYIPCFFCRSSEPLILSIVGVAEDVNVTFEIIDYPHQTHANPRTFLKSPFYHTVLRVPWPAKMYNSTLSLKHIHEKDIFQMTCHCQAVEDEANRAYGEPKCSVSETALVESVSSIKSSEMAGECNSGSKNFGRSKIKGEEDSSILARSDLSSLARKESEENSVATLSSHSAVESVQSNRFQLEFLKVSHQTPMIRQFVIRNETAIETNFQINVANYGESKNIPERRLLKIKNRVFARSQDDFQEKLTRNQPLVIVVEPSSGELKPFDALCINVTCYGNTWGEYSDELICRIQGMEPYHLKVLIQVLGHPIQFPKLKTELFLKPTLWFQPLSPFDNPVSKEIKVRNSSAIPLTLLCFVFLMKPIIRDREQEESLTDGNPNFDSSHSTEGSTESVKNYIPKNASKSASTLMMSIEGKDFGPNSESYRSFAKSESSLSLTSGKREKGGESQEHEKIMSVLLSEASSKSEFQQQIVPGRCDVNIFKVEPRDISFEPFEEKSIKVTFDPQFFKPKEFPADFWGVLTGCVKLKPEDELCQDRYYRPGGINFVSELLDFKAVVEIPFVSFEILNEDVRFMIDSNAIITSGRKSYAICKKYLIKNRNQKTLFLTIDVVPGFIFKVKSVSTIDKFYPEYNSSVHTLQVEPGQVIEMELQCLITHKDVMCAFEDLKRSRKNDTCGLPVEEMKKMNASRENKEPGVKKEPWRQSPEFFRGYENHGSLKHKDSFELNLNRMSPNSTNSSCYIKRNEYGENEGEYFELQKANEIVCKPKSPKHVAVIKEEISFIQSKWTAQSFVAELHISYPALKITATCIDFGNVFLDETATRFFSVINLTGFPTDFRVMAKINAAEFEANPLTGSLPSCDYNLDIGKTITIKFKPSRPGYFKEVYHIYANLNLEFDYWELFVCGLGTWNEKYRAPRYETYTKLEGFNKQ